MYLLGQPKKKLNAKHELEMKHLSFLCMDMRVFMCVRVCVCMCEFVHECVCVCEPGDKNESDKTLQLVSAIMHLHSIFNEIFFSPFFYISF